MFYSVSAWIYPTCHGSIMTTQLIRQLPHGPFCLHLSENTAWREVCVRGFGPPSHRTVPQPRCLCWLTFIMSKLARCTFAREISLPWDCFLSRMSHTPRIGNVQLAPSPRSDVLFHLHFHWERYLHKASVCERREAEAGGRGISLGRNKETWNTVLL